MGPKYYLKYELYSELFLEIISDNTYFYIWNKNKNFFGHLRNIFATNNFHFGKVYDKIYDIYGDDQYSQHMGPILLKLINEGNLITKEINECDGRYFQMNSKFIDKILNYYNKKSSLCQGTYIFYDLMRACYPINKIKDYVYDLNYFICGENKKNIIAFKNVIISYYSYFFEKYKNINLDKLPIGAVTVLQFPHLTGRIVNELSKSGIYVTYFKEENIGGKSNTLINKNVHGHVFISTEIFKNLNTESSIHFNILVRLTSLIDKFFFAYYEVHSLFKDYLYGDYIPSESGTQLMNSYFRYYFYLFNDQCQIILYHISFFLIKWINHQVLGINKMNILLLPIYLLDLPFQIAQLMLISNSKIINDDNYRKELNKKSDLFKNDDFLESLAELFVSLFEDIRLCNYSNLVQSLGWKIYFFTKTQKTRKLILSKEGYINKIILGVSNIINMNNSERINLRIITALQRCAFDQIELLTKEDIELNDTYVNNMKKLLKSENYKDIFSNIIKEYCKNLNTKLTTYKVNLNNCKKYCIDTDFNGNNIKKYVDDVKFAYKGVISLITFYEFIMSISQDNFFNQEQLDVPITYSRNLFVSLTSHILNAPFFEELQKVLDYIHISNYNIFFPQ
jgi:hypothetical protein